MLVLERDGERVAPSGASHVAAGMLAPVAEADPSRARRARARDCAARALWPGFAAELSEASGVDIGYRRAARCSSRTTPTAPRPSSASARCARRWVSAPPRLLGSEARRLEGALAPGVRLALDLADDHAVDPRGVVRALRAALGDRSAFCGAGVAAIESGAVALDGGETRSTAERIVVAAGAWSGALAGVPVRPVKGQLLRLRDPAGAGLVDRVLRFEGGYLVPRGDGRYVLGATTEERGFDIAVTAGARLRAAARRARSSCPGVLELEIEEMIAGLRPGTPDNAPLIGPHEELDGVLLATGHHRGGVLMAPVTAELVVDALAGVAA